MSAVDIGSQPGMSRMLTVQPLAPRTEPLPTAFAEPPVQAFIPVKVDAPLPVLRQTSADVLKDVLTLRRTIGTQAAKLGDAAPGKLERAANDFNVVLPTAMFGGFLSIMTTVGALTVTAPLGEGFLGVAAGVFAAVALSTPAVRFWAHKRNEKRGRIALPAVTVTPLAIRYAKADGVEREALRLVAKEVANDLKERAVRGPEARQTINAIAAEKRVDDVTVRRQADAITTIACSVYEPTGSRVPALDDSSVRTLIGAIEHLPAADRDAARAVLLPELFDGDKPRIKMSRHAELTLYDAMIAKTPIEKSR